MKSSGRHSTADGAKVLTGIITSDENSRGTHDPSPSEIGVEVVAARAVSFAREHGAVGGEAGRSGGCETGTVRRSVGRDQPHEGAVGLTQRVGTPIV